MKILLYSTLASSLLVAAPAAQRIGNPDAPTVGQSIAVGDRSLEISYQAVSWGQGRWAQNLTEQMRAMINQSAVEAPLGRLQTSTDLVIGGQPVPAGTYALAFMLGEEDAWEMVLSADGSRVVVPLALGMSLNVRKRLVLAVMPGDEEFSASLLVAFGNQVCQLAIGPDVAEKVAGQPDPRRGVINTRCPLMDDPVVSEYTVLYKGYNIGLCCDVCFEEWDVIEADEKDLILRTLLDGGDAPPAEEVTVTVIDNPMCPLMDEPVVEGFSITYRGVRFGVCCRDCILEWNKLPVADREEILAKIW